VQESHTHFEAQKNVLEEEIMKWMKIPKVVIERER
jgi:hypothetical protein